MSVLDRKPNNLNGCFGFSMSQEDPNQDILKPQIRNHDKVSSLSTEDQKKKNEIDSMLSEAMNELSFEERQYQQEILHGVEDQIAEEATFIKSALEQLDIHLNRSKGGTVYETAERMDPAYVRAKPLRLMFLRCNQYDGKASADQMFRFFKLKLDLFGQEKLVRDITIEDDLDEDDRASLESGWNQFVGKDRSGRVINLGFPGLRTFKILKNELRGSFFMSMHLLQSDEASQFKGVVGISYCIGKFRDRKNGAGYTEQAFLVNAVPLKRVGIHFCLDEISEYLLMGMAIKVLPAGLRSRIRLHFGSHLECQYKLSTYGVSTLFLPLDPRTGVLHLDRHKRWLRPCFSQAETGHNVVRSQSSGSRPTITQPKVNDVLLGGKCHSQHMGNQFLKALVLEWSPVYDAASDNEVKRTVVDNVVLQIEMGGGRFLKGENGAVGEEVSWQLVPYEQVRKRVAQLFRNRRRKKYGS